MEDMELLVQETHNRGLKIILDIALNHTANTVSIQDFISGCMLMLVIQARMVPNLQARSQEPSSREAGLVFLEPRKAGRARETGSAK